MSLRIIPINLTTAEQVLYTAPAGLESCAHAIIFSNLTAEPATYSLRHFHLEDNTTYDLALGFSVEGLSAVAWPGPINMMPGDTLLAYASSSNAVVCEVSAYENPTYLRGLTFRANWNTTTQYFINDIVAYSGKNYAAMSDNLGTNPASSPLVWTEFTIDLSNYNGVSSFSAGSTGLLPNRSMGGSVVLGGTLNVGSGGTGATTIDAARANLGAAPVTGPTFYDFVNFGTASVRQDTRPVTGNVIDCSLGNYFTKTVEANTTFVFFNAPINGSYGFVFNIRLNFGNISWPGNVKWPNNTPPQLIMGHEHIMLFWTDNGGTTFYGAYHINYPI